MKLKLVSFLIILFGIIAHAQFGPQQIITDNALNASSVFAADINGDGYVDVLSSSQGDNTIAWYENLDGEGNFSSKNIITDIISNPRTIYVIDIDGDGDMDVLGTSFDVGLILWYENLDGQGSFSPRNIISNQTIGAIHVHGADLDGDGDIDVLSASRGDNKVAWYKNLDGQGNFSDQIIITNTANTVDTVSAADIDNDGDMDVVYGAGGLGKLAWYENVGGEGDFSIDHVVSNSLGGINSLFVIDLDNDEDLDIICTAADDTLQWFENIDGEGSYGPIQNIDSGFWAPRWVHAADLDNDNDADIMIAIGGDNSIVWYENWGSGIFGEQQLISDQTEGARSVYAADFDGDGYKDVLSASIVDSKIAWYKNTAYLGLDDKELQGISLYPNPVETILYIKTENNLTVNFIEVYDVQGRLILKEKITVDKVDLSRLNNGLYFVNIQTAQGVLVKKVIKD